MRSPSLMAAYQRETARHGFVDDPVQRAAIARLEVLRLALNRSAPRRAGLAGRLRARLGRPALHEAVPGAYLWGEVGRGKTFLMDLFHASLRVPAKRTHFHRFMREVHGRLREQHEAADPLVQVASGIAADCRVICFDELFVSDVADAMILAGLFRNLLEAAVTLVFTSNLPPGELYRDGLQRQRFLPAIELIERHTELLALDGATDYRLRQLERAPLYVSAATCNAEAVLAQRFEAIAGQPGSPGGSIEIESREIPVRRRSSGVIWFGFEELCDGPRSTVDYIEIARSYQTVLISGVPRFDSATDDKARRFIALVDEFYDRGVKLLLSAEGPPADLYQGERLAFEFRRTASRLAEMQTRDYLQRPHRP